MAKANPTSTFALVSIRSGRRELARRVAAGDRFPVTLRGTISVVWGHDDGVDQEFQIDVSSIDIREPRKRKSA